MGFRSSILLLHPRSSFVLHSIPFCKLLLSVPSLHLASVLDQEPGSVFDLRCILVESRLF